MRFRFPLFSQRQILYLSVITFLALLATASAQQSRGQIKASAKPHAVSRYELIELPLRPNAISNTGWIAGMAPDQMAALVDPHGKFIPIVLPAEFALSEALGVNSQGDAVGYGATSDSAGRVAFLFHDGKVTVLPGEQARAYSINDAGEIVGQGKVPGQKTISAVVWKKNPDGSYAVADLNICCAGSARAINGQSVAVGDVYDEHGLYHAFLWDAQHGARLIPVPKEEHSSVLAFNDRGQVVLRAAPGGLTMYEGGKFMALNLPLADPRAMNEAGTIVGPFGAGPEAQKAFVWDKTHGLEDLNDQIPHTPGWKLLVATGINDHGEIIGWGEHGLVENAGFLLRPRQAPSTPHIAPKKSPAN